MNSLGHFGGDMLKRVLCVLVVFISSLFAAPVSAQSSQITGGLAWLSTAQTTTGNWQMVDTSEYYSTAAALDALFVLDSTSESYARGLQWMSGQMVSPTDYLSRSIIARKRAGMDVSFEVDTLILYRNPEGGWGCDDDYVNDVIDTALALQALKAANYADLSVVNAGLEYLIVNQNADGGWGFFPGDRSNTYMAALVSGTLQKFPQTTAIATAIGKATSYLLAHRNTDGGFGSSPSTIYETALAYEALAAVSTDATVLGKAVTYLTATQAVDGSWNQDPYSTALALRALHIAETRPVTPPPAPTTGIVNGTVVDAAASLPLSGVTAALASDPAVKAVTNEAGAFSLADVPQGPQEITFSLSGYEPAAATTSVTSGSIVNIGSISLTAVANTATVQGTISDVSGNQLAGVTVTVIGTGTWTATTGTNGSFRITAVEPGVVTITAGKAGYQTVSGTGAIAAGSSLIFSPALSPSASTGGLLGKIVDLVTGNAIQGAAATCTSAATGTSITSMTNASGVFSFAELDHGNYALSLAAPGYLGQSYTVTVSSGVTADIGAIRLSAVPVTGTIHGTVTDGASGTGLSGATITLSDNGTWTVITGPDGSYQLTGVNAGSTGTITASKEGYYSVSAPVSLAAGGTLIFSPALSATPPSGTTGSLKGSVSDAAGGQPIGGAAVTASGPGAYATTTGISGVFEFPEMAPGVYTVTIGAPGYIEQTYSLTVMTGVLTDLGRVPLTSSPVSGVVSGVITDLLSGAALEGATVTVSGAATLQATTAADGTYRISGVEPGTVVLSAQRTGYGSAEGTAVVAAGSFLIFSPALAPAPTTGELRGTVIDNATGAPVPGAVISLTPNPAGTIPAATTDDAGVFSLTGIPAGSYTATISAPGYGVRNSTGAIVAGVVSDMGTLAISLLPTSTTVTGIITDVSTGNPVPGAEVSVSGTNLSVKTDSAGMYAIQGIDALEFIVTVSAAGFDSRSYTVQTAAFGMFTVDSGLSPSRASNLTIASLSMDRTTYPGNSDTAIAAAIENAGDTSTDVYVVAKVKNETGEVVAIAYPDAPEMTISPLSTGPVGLTWNTGQFAPGTYELILEATEPVAHGSIRIPGAILARKAFPFVIEPLVQVSDGVVRVDPTYIHTGTAQTVNLAVSFMNRSNITARITIEHEMKTPSGAVLNSGATPVDLGLDIVAARVPLATFDHAFNEAGEYPVRAIVYNDGRMVAEVNTTFVALGNIRIEPSRTVTPEAITPDGTRTVTVNINLAGIGDNATPPPPEEAPIETMPGYKTEIAASGLLMPVGLKSNAAAEIFVVESKTDRILKIQLDGAVTVFASSKPGLPLDFAPGYATKMDIDANGNLYFACVGWYDNPYNPYGDVLDTIYRIGPDASITKVARMSVSPYYFNDVSAVALSADAKYLYAADTWSAHDILKIDLSTKTSTRFAASVYAPYDMLLDAEGNLYATMAAYSGDRLRIHKYAPNGARTVYNDSIAYPIAIAWGPEGYLYVSDWSTKAIYTIDPATGDVATFATGFNSPLDIEFDPQGNLYVVESQKGQVLKISRAASVFNDVRLIEDIPSKDAELLLSSMTRTPYSITPEVDRTIAEWRFDRIIAGQDENVSYGLDLSNLIPGENRVVANKLQLIYHDSNNTEITVDLASLFVHVLNSAFTGTVSTDKPAYQANQDAVVGSAITNLSEYARTIDARVIVEDGKGNVVQEIGVLAGLTFAAGETKDLAPLVFHTGSYYAGDYRARLQLYEGGNQVGTALTDFTIVPDIAVSSGITTDKISYKANEQAVLVSSLQSASANAMIENLTARISVKNSRGGLLQTESRQIALLAPGQRLTVDTFWNTGSSPAGAYSATLEVLSGDAILSASSAQFEIVSTAVTGGGLTGSLTVSPDRLYQGEPETLAATVTNNGNEDVAGLTARILVVDPDTEETKLTFTSGDITLDQGATFADTRSPSTMTLMPGFYLAVLQVQTSSMAGPKTLASAGFKVEPGIEVTKKIADQKRVLVWLNYPWQSGRNCPDRAAIEQALTNAGLLYLIVLDKDVFEQEFRNRFYTDFMILGDHHPLEDHFAAELREQVNAGKGLIHSLFNRQNLDSPVFDLKVTGILPAGCAAGSGDCELQSRTIEFAESEIAPAGTFRPVGRVLKVEASDQADVVAWTQETTNKGTVNYPVVIRRPYGQGHVIFFAFDLGMSASSHPAYLDLILNSAAYVHGSRDTALARPGQLIPVEVTIKSLGPAYGLRLSEEYPAGAQIYDPASDLWINDNPWIRLVDLAADETKTLLYYAVMPDEAGNYSFATEIEYANDGSYVFYQSRAADVTIGNSTTAETPDILSALQALVLSGAEASSRDNAVRYLTNVGNTQVQNQTDREAMIDDLRKAATELLGITSQDMTNIRSGIDLLLLFREADWYSHRES